ncbi:LysE family translocator [Alphaproteobacteria bacterium]|nr:LysE family translocator [Alphaproteobacteria bacterium]
MDIFDWLTITLVCFIGAITPGPSLIVIIYITNSKNLVSGFLASLGHGFGIFLYALISIYILNIIIAYLPISMALIQILGSIFLIYISLKLIFFKPYKNSSKSKIEFSKPNFNNFFVGLTTSLINPKILIFFSSVFSQFIESDYSVQTKLTMALLAGLIDAFWYILVSYSINTKKIQNYLKLKQSIIFLILGIILLFFSSYLILKSIEYFL